MNPDFRYALYVFCANHHTGMNSRLYRLMSRMRVHLKDRHWKAIEGNRHTRQEMSRACWEEWEEARKYYRELKRSKYAHEKR